MKTYRQSLDELHFTREEKNAMVDRLTAGESRGSGKVRSIRRTVTVGVAAALLMTMGVGAAVTLTPAGEVFASIFGDSPAQTEILDRMGVPIGASDTADGVTITADAIIGDTYSYAVVYSIARDDGQPLAEDLTPLEGTDGTLPLTFDQSDTFIRMLGGSHGSAYFYDADPTDAAIQYVVMMTMDTPIEPGTATATFQNLYLCSEDARDRTLLAEGNWKIRFQFQFPDSGVSLDAGQTFQLSGMEATLDGVTISPLSIQVDYTVHQELVWSENRESGRENEYDREQSYRYFESLPVVITYTDGTTQDLTNAGGGITPGDGETVCQKSRIFDELRPLDEVASVTVGDIVLPVSAG